MFGGSKSFGAPVSAAPAFGAVQQPQQTAFGGFGAAQAAPAFGAAAPAAGAFGAPQQQQPGGLFGAAAPQPQQPGGLFGQPAVSQAPAFGGFGAAATQAPAATSFMGGASVFGKPAATGFGATAQPVAGQPGGLFGQPGAAQPAQGGFGAPATAGAFGQPAAQPGFGGAYGAQQQQQTGSVYKFNAPTGTDTMMKSGVTTNINTRHQCITCMKEYEQKSMEELRCEDYMANRKGGAMGATMGAGQAAPGGLFGAPPNQVATSTAGGFFGAQTPATSQPGGLFGQQQAKPLFGAATSTGYGAVSSAGAFGATTSAFGTTTAGQAGGGLFGKPAATGFGAPVSQAGGFGGFGATTAAPAAGGLFGATSMAKPAAFGTTTTQSGGLFGAPAQSTGFGAAAAPAFGAPGAAGAFGQPAAGGAFGQPAAQPGGLFGSTAAKPAGAFGAPGGAFGAPAVSAAQPGFGGFGAGAQAGAFGAAAAKPAFGAFGAPTSTAGAFGAFGAAQPAAAGGMFGAAAKPNTLSFGAAGGLGQPAQAGFGGGFGAAQPAAAGGLFGGAAAAKPAGMFGATTGAFGATTGAFGAGTTSFNAGGLGAPAAGGMFGGGAASYGMGQAQTAYGAAGQQAAAPQSNNPIQQQLLQLANSPYGENPLFKNLLQDSGKREEILKPINPSAQKALDGGNVYKVSPHRNIKAKAKPLSGASGSGANKSTIFDGLEDNDDLNKSSDLFVPRSSVKKLILKPKSPMVSTPKDDTSASMQMTPNTAAAKKKGLIIPSPPNLEFTADETTLNKKGDDSVIGGGLDHPEESFTIQRKITNPDTTTIGEDSFAAQHPSTAADNSDLSHEDDDEENNNPAGVKLKRAGYYTIPALSELGALVDSAAGNCLVENFTVGRTGYGNLFFPGMTDVMGMNLDEVVFFRHKEVTVYPDDSSKPAHGTGLNKKAQVTLDRVWPVDKTHKTSIKSPEKLSNMNYEEKLQKACLKLDARFVEYRVETGSWVFKVDHFSKYGLDESDEENDDANKNAANANNNKKLKTLLPLRKDAGQLTTTTATIHSDPRKTFLDQQQADIGLEILKEINPNDDMTNNNSLLMEETMRQQRNNMEVSPPSQQQLTRISAQGQKVQLMKASLFEDDEEAMDSQQQQNQPRPVILQRRDPMVDDIAHSLLPVGSSAGKGLGGSFSMQHQPATVTSNLLRTRFLGEGSMQNVLDNSGPSMLGTSTQSKPQTLPTYTLQAGYDKFVSLPSSGAADKQRCIVPRYSDHLRPLEESLFANKLKLLADGGLAMGRRFRPGWAGNWRLSHCGAPFDPLAGCSRISLVHMERVEVSSFGHADDEQIGALESWLEVALDNAVVAFEGDYDEEEKKVPKFSVEESVNTLHSFAEEAKKQLTRCESADASFGRGLKEAKNVWDLCLALWGRLKEREIFEYGPDSHETTMLRRDAVSEWLEDAVAAEAKADLETAVLKGDHVDEILALLSANRLDEACAKAHAAGDHYAALLMASAGGLNSVNGQMILQQLDRWQELRADKHVAANRLRLYALLAGVPVWPGSDGLRVNVCDGLDWKRALASHFWFLTSPVASVADAFAAYESAFEEDSEEETYAHMPNPEYDVLEAEARDVKYHLLKLYTQRSHSLETLLTPKTHTPDQLDHRLSWFLREALMALGYGHLRQNRVDQLHLSFASQLETFGLWHWAVFILLHLDDAEFRRSTIIAMLGRHLKLSDDECADRETFLMDQLRVPMAWIAEAKAVKAGAERNPKDQAWYLIKAGSFAKAHDVIVKEIAPGAVIDEEYDFLHTLLKDLEDRAASILDWDTRGGVFLDFIKVNVEVQTLLERRGDADVDFDYHLEALRPKVSSLCARVGSLPTRNARERLCQSEIAKRLAGLARASLQLGGAPSARALAEQLSQLPMPEDYALQELRTLTRNYMMEIMES